MSKQRPQQQRRRHKSYQRPAALVPARSQNENNNASSQPVRLTTSERISNDGKAIAHLESGKIVFVKGALANEDVEVRIFTEKKDFALAQVTAIIRPSPQRTEPGCPQFAKGCGGCQLWHVDDTVQKQLKEKWLFDALERLGKWPADIRSQIAGHIEHATLSATAYRHRLRVHIQNGKVGFFKNHSHDIVDASPCLTSSTRLPLREIVSGLSQLNLQAECEITVSHDNFVSIRAIGVNQAEVDRLFSSKSWWVNTDTLLSIEHPFHPQFKIHTAGFVQAHEQAQTCYVNFCVDAVKLFLKTNPSLPQALTAWDLYAGCGVFSAIPALAATGFSKTVGTVAVEGIKAAASQIQKNWSGLKNIHVCIQDVDAFLNEAHQPVQIVITDPSREGMSRLTTEKLVKHCDRHAQVIYIACDAASLARDGAVLIANGFRPVRTLLADAFGKTVHFETLMVFER